MSKQETIYYIETKDGGLMRVPESNLTEFLKIHRAVKTPKHWKNTELVRTTTAYGNEVMIPKDYIDAWEAERQVYESSKSKNIDLSVGVENLELSMSLSAEKKNALLVFYEKYQD